MIKLHGFPILAPNDKVICSSSSGDRKAPWRASGVCSIVSILIQEGQRTGAGLNRYLSSYIWETQQGSKGGRAGNKAPVNPETPWTFEQIWWPRGLAPEDSRNLWHGESEKLPVTWGCFWGSADDAAGDGFVVCVRWVWGSPQMINRIWEKSLGTRPWTCWWTSIKTQAIIGPSLYCLLRQGIGENGCRPSTENRKYLQKQLP